MRIAQRLSLLLCAAYLFNGCGGGGSGTPPPPPAGPAAALQVTTSLPVGIGGGFTANAGTGFSITVTAVDASGNLASSYSGTVHFTSTDTQASLPKDSLLTHGSGTFSVTLKTAGGQSINATDTVNAGLAASLGVAVNPGPATQFSINTVSAATTGLAFNVSVTALDAFGNQATSYAGTVNFTSTDAQAALPSAKSPLSSGAGNFMVSLKTLGAQKITATDSVTASLTATSGSINVVSNAATHFAVSGPGSTNARATFSFPLTALDAANNTSLAYSGTVQFSSTDKNAMLPASSKLVAGTGNFSATLETAGMQNIIATDTSTASITGMTSINVNTAAALAITSGAPPAGSAGLPYDPRQVNIRICRDIVFPGTCFYPGYRKEPATGFPLLGTGGVPPLTWSWAPAMNSSLPPGLSILNLGTSSGCLAQAGTYFVTQASCINGTPAQTGTYQVVLTMTDSGLPAAQITANYSITINLPPPPSVNTTAPPGGVENLPYSFTFTATGAQPLTWSESGGLPSGLAFDDNSGTLSGKPTQTGSFPISVTATDPFKQSSAAADFTIVVTAHGFALTGSMATARRFHTATLLGNGKVLIAGGEDAGSNAFASAELYDPSTGTFSPTGNMTVPRVGHTATLLNNGKVLITGGTSDPSENAISSAELYDPSTGTFAATTGSMANARASHTATLLKDGTVLVAGGDVIFFNGVQNANIKSLASAEIFNPNTGTFTATGDMTAAREAHTATLLNDGRVLVAGGSDGAVGNTTSAATVYASAELFDPSTGHFTATGSMSAARDFLAATLLNTGKVLVTGGVNPTNFLNTAELFDPSTGSFTATGTMTAARFYHDATLLSDGTVLLTGGSDGSNRALATAEIYDPNAGTFAATGSMNFVRVWHTSTLLPSGIVLVTGGADNDSLPQATAELYQ